MLQLPPQVLPVIHQPSRSLYLVRKGLESTVESGTIGCWRIGFSDMQRALRGHSDGEAMDTLIFHLEGVAKEKVKLRPTSRWSSLSGVFTILREVFSEQLTETKARWKFFARRQGDRGSVQDFAQALMVLLSRVDSLGRAPVTNKDTLLKEQFIENLRDPTLHRDIKHWARDHSATTFQDAYLEVHTRYMV